MESIVITGASGFLAQHLIRELQGNAEISQCTKELRLVDKVEFEKFLDYEENIKTSFHQIDCTDENGMRRVLTGATVVFHLAAKRYDFGLFPKENEYWMDNFEDPELSCAFIRPTLIYGEGDSGLVPSVVRMVKNCNFPGLPKRTMPLIGNGDGGAFHMIYAGNAAHLLVKAYEFQRKNPAEINGEVTFGTENGPAENVQEFLTPIVKSSGCAVSPRMINYYLAFIYAAFFQAFWNVANLCSPSFVEKYAKDWPDWTVIRLSAAWVFGFESAKQRTFLDYLPKYTPEDAYKNTVAWWKKKFSQQGM